MGMILVMALLDVIGVASVMPFMAVLSNPEVVETNPYLNAVYQSLGYTDLNAFLFFLGIVVFVALIASIGFKVITTYNLLHFAEMSNYSLGRRLVAGYLRQPYVWFLGRHSADLGKTVLSEAQQVINGALIPIMQIIAHGAVVIGMVILLISVNPLLATSAVAALGGVYAIIYLSLRSYLSRIGADRVRANLERYQIVQETFGGIKDVKISGLEGAMLNRFSGPAMRYAQRQANAMVASQLPRYALDAIAFCGMLLVALYLMRGPSGLQNALPVLAVYAFAGYRLMPGLLQIYVQIAKLRFAGPALDALHADLIQLASDGEENLTLLRAKPMGLDRSLKLRNISYRYPNADHLTLNDLSLEVPVHTTVGLVGSTGSGKTTTVDLILGLLWPEKGQLLVDDNVITRENFRNWQQTIGYVPQSIYLIDDSVAANIAFGVSEDQINQEAVERASRVANLHDFVIKEMPAGYDTMVGERGVRLSGGQRQRIGIARALYNDPEVLILDEATSALDNLTEQAVMEAVHNLGHRKTVILIAHRLSTVRECDNIFLLEQGRIVSQGTYDDLLNTSDQFRKMTEGM